MWRKKMRTIVFILIFTILCGCAINPPENKEYVPFECTSMPEDRLYFPEEPIVFSFNMDINDLSVDGFSAVSSISQEILSFKISGKSISILPPLPANDTIVISITSQLKSVDNKPLQIGGSFSEEKKTLDIEYKTGSTLPEIESYFPDDTKSSAFAVKFSSLVEIDQKNIVPAPEDIFQIENWLVLVFSKPVSTVTIKKAKPADRDVILEDIKITLPETEPVIKDLAIDYTSTDSTISVNITDDSAVAAKINDTVSVCEKKCSIVLEGLKPSKKYDLSINVYTSTGVKIETTSVITGDPAPHIIISEIMHTPILEPEKNWEFVEIYNYGELDFDLTDCFVDDRNDGSGKDPLLLKNLEGTLVLKPGELAVVTGNEADFSSIADSALWLIVDDTTIADSGITSNESIQIICIRDEQTVIEDSFDPTGIKSERGYSINTNTDGTYCISEENGGTPGKYYDCP